ncbi:hypothetical protein ARNL5_01175 [Anaerolineae bacterium]|nr:hypothetical protein ARNL5_01175 [Anaerolineae bacterium]
MKVTANTAMDIQFFDQSEVPQPRDQIRIEKLTPEPYPDGWRIKVSIEVTPFQERPSLELRIRNEQRVIAELSIIETMHRHMEFTVHVRGVTSPYGPYWAECDLYYEDRLSPQHRVSVPFVISPNAQSQNQQEEVKS